MILSMEIFRPDAMPTLVVLAEIGDQVGLQSHDILDQAKSGASTRLTVPSVEQHLMNHLSIKVTVNLGG